MPAILHFAETEPADEEFFRAALPELELRFAQDAADVPADAEILSVFINSTIDEAFLTAHPALRFIATRSGAFDHIDVRACTARGVAVSWVPDYGAESTAEHTFALLLAVSRRLREMLALSQQSGPHRFSYDVVRGFDLAGKTIGIIGMGRVGQRVATLARAFGMRIVAHDPFDAPPALAAELGFAWRTFSALLAEAQVITLHARLTPETYHLLDRHAFAQCVPGAIVINTARGRLIDTGALRAALESGQIGGAGLDVLEDERLLRESVSQVISAEIIERLHADTPPREGQQRHRVRALQRVMQSEWILSRTNVVFTPHVAFNSVETVERIQAATVENLRAFLAGAPVNLASPE